MSARTIVIALEEEGGTRGEVNAFDHAQDAERFIESLLEQGFGQQSIRVLRGEDMDLLVTLKPVVALLSTETGMGLPAAEMGAAIEAAGTDVPNYDAEPVQVEGLESGMERELVAAAVGAHGDPFGERKPYMQNGIKFSSAFARPY